MVMAIATTIPFSYSHPLHRGQSTSFRSICRTSKPIFRKIYGRKTLVALNGVSNIHKQSNSRNRLGVSGVNSNFCKWILRNPVLPRRIAMKSTSAEGRSTLISTISQKVIRVLHLLVSLGLILAMDKYLKQAFVVAAIKFPSALFGMFCIFSVFVVLDVVIPAAATGVMKFFQTAFTFIQRWLPLFYVSSLVVLPLSVRDILAASGLKICYIIGIIKSSMQVDLFSLDL